MSSDSIPCSGVSLLLSSVQEICDVFTKGFLFQLSAQQGVIRCFPFWGRIGGAEQQRGRPELVLSERVSVTILCSARNDIHR